MVSEGFKYILLTNYVVGSDVLVFCAQMGRGIHHENGHGTENEWSTGGEEHFSCALTV